jgi:pyruvate/2-oxoglutarate dehydrogenase complex dihydrolipoamide acyltransferase (E2) component
MEFRKANLDAFQKRHGLKLGFMSAFMKASAYALQDQPVVNAVIDGGDIVYRDYVDMSVAVATPKVTKKKKMFTCNIRTGFLKSLVCCGRVWLCR